MFEENQNYPQSKSFFQSYSNICLHFKVKHPNLEYNYFIMDKIIVIDNTENVMICFLLYFHCSNYN